MVQIQEGARTMTTAHPGILHGVAVGSIAAILSCAGTLRFASTWRALMMQFQ
jgi:hypothetical protein